MRRKNSAWKIAGSQKDDRNQGNLAQNWIANKKESYVAIA
jgi:hypothetical protein